MKNLTPSARKGGAQRLLTSTMLVVEAFIVFFAMLAAHGLLPESRAITWGFGGVVALAMFIVSLWVRRSNSATPYLVGAVLQVPMILMGIWMTPMWAIGVLMAALYIYSVVQGHRFDLEKDRIDAQWYAQHGSAPDPVADHPRA